MSEQERRREIAERLDRLGTRAVTAISTGVVSLDWVLGVGGFPRGAMTEVFGPEAAGKTTIAMHAIARAQQAGGTAAFIDVDHALATAYARSVGVDFDHLLLSQPSCGEEALEIAARLAASRAVDLLVLDSVAALVPRMELEGAASDALAGLQQRLIAQALRRLASAAARTGCCLLFLNQVRQRAAAVGDPETTAGGHALRLHSAVRLEIIPLSRFAQHGQVAGLRVRVRAVKNRLAVPYREAEFDIRYAEGIARDEDLAACAARCGIAVPELSLERHPDAREALDLAVRRALGLPAPA